MTTIPTAGAAVRRARTTITAADVRAAIFGRYTDAIVVNRQARRLVEGDSDELVLLVARSDWWIVRRVSDVVTVWACGSQYHADRQFDQQLLDCGRRGQWAEVQPGAEQAARRRDTRRGRAGNAAVAEQGDRMARGPAESPTAANAVRYGQVRLAERLSG